MPSTDECGMPSTDLCGFMTSMCRFMPSAAEYGIILYVSE